MSSDRCRPSRRALFPGLEVHDGIRFRQLDLTAGPLRRLFQLAVHDELLAPLAVGVVVADEGVLDAARERPADDVLDAAVAPVHLRNRRGGADALLAQVLGDAVLAVEIAEVRALAMALQPLLGGHALALTLVGRVGPVAELVVGAEDERLAAPLDLVSQHAR